LSKDRFDYVRDQVQRHRFSLHRKSPVLNGIIDKNSYKYDFTDNELKRYKMSGYKSTPSIINSVSSQRQVFIWIDISQFLHSKYKTLK
jgi:hypothetical protein